MNTIDTSQIAGVVIGQRFWSHATVRRQLEAAVAQQLREKLGVVQYLILPAKLRIVFEEHVHAMRTMGEDPPHVIFAERGYVGRGQFLKKEFVAQPPCGIPRAFFLRAEHREIHAGGIEQFDNGARDSLGTAIISSGATDPIQDLEARILLHGWSATGRSFERRIIHAAVGVWPSRGGFRAPIQSARSAAGRPQGLAADCMRRSAVAAGPLNPPSPTRYLRISRIKVN